MEVLLHKGPLPINTIGEKVLLTSGSMTAAINRLEKRGLVKRVRDTRDGRSFYIHLTRSGKTVIKEAFHKHTENLESVVVELTQEERKELTRLLKKLGRQAEAQL